MNTHDIVLKIVNQNQTILDLLKSGVCENNTLPSNEVTTQDTDFLEYYIKNVVLLQEYNLIEHLSNYTNEEVIPVAKRVLDYFSVLGNGGHTIENFPFLNGICFKLVNFIKNRGVDANCEFKFNSANIISRPEDECVSPRDKYVEFVLTDTLEYYMDDLEKLNKFREMYSREQSRDIFNKVVEKLVEKYSWSEFKYLLKNLKKISFVSECTDTKSNVVNGIYGISNVNNSDDELISLDVLDEKHNLSDLIPKLKERFLECGSETSEKIRDYIRISMEHLLYDADHKYNFNTFITNLKMCDNNIAVTIVNDIFTEEQSKTPENKDKLSFLANTLRHFKIPCNYIYSDFHKYAPVFEYDHESLNDIYRAIVDNIHLLIEDEEKLYEFCNNNCNENDDTFRRIMCGLKLDFVNKYMWLDEDSKESDVESALNKFYTLKNVSDALDPECGLKSEADEKLYEDVFSKLAGWGACDSKIYDIVNNNLTMLTMILLELKVDKRLVFDAYYGDGLLEKIKKDVNFPQFIHDL